MKWIRNLLWMGRMAWKCVGGVCARRFAGILVAGSGWDRRLLRGGEGVGRRRGRAVCESFSQPKKYYKGGL